MGMVRISCGKGNVPGGAWVSSLYAAVQEGDGWAFKVDRMRRAGGNAIHIGTSRRSMDSITSDCRRWAEEIGKTYQPDLVVFIAKSGFLFAKPIAEYFGCEMADILVGRPAGRVKDRLKTVIRLMPEKAVMKILKMPLMYKFNEKKGKRDVELSVRYKEERRRPHGKILIVDDSVDTGLTLQCVHKIVREDFPDAAVRTAGYAVIDYSRKRISVDYYRYRNMVVLTATSRKSSQYGAFLRQYEAWKAQEGRGQHREDKDAGSGIG